MIDHGYSNLLKFPDIGNNSSLPDYSVLADRDNKKKMKGGNIIFGS